MHTNGNHVPRTDNALHSANTTDAAEPHVAESHTVTRMRTFDSGMDVGYLLGLLRNQLATGTLHIDLNQGGISNIRFEEKQKL
jgi:hypothetical protein